MDISNIQIDRPFAGISIYRNVLDKGLSLPARLESTLTPNTTGWLRWSPALVGDFQSMPDYRDCVDFKVRKKDFELRPLNEVLHIKSIYEDVNSRLHVCLSDYLKPYNLTMEYQEAINFVRYGENQHFAVHSDSGFSYTCNVSSVMYLNDNFEGGELYFPHIDYTYKPSEGDVVLFPSNWLFSHASLPVKSGIKYSAVTMFDYTDRFHSEEFRRLMHERALKEDATGVQVTTL